MKRLLLSILMILTLAAAGVSAQDKAARRAFEKGLAAAGRENFAAALGDFERALTLAEPAAAGDDFRAAIYFNIGVCRYRLKDSARAVREFETAIELKKGVYEKAFYALGMADAELGDWPAAERAFRAALGLNANNGETWFDLAFVYLARNDYQQARAAFEKSLALGTNAAAVGHNNLGVLLAVGGETTAAVREFEAALKESGGRFPEAARNLQLCRARDADLTARLEFKK